MDEMMGRANKSIMSLNSIMIEYISGMKLIKAYNMGSKSFQKFSSAIQEENEVWTLSLIHILYVRIYYNGGFFNGQVHLR